MANKQALMQLVNMLAGQLQGIGQQRQQRSMQRQQQGMAQAQMGMQQKRMDVQQAQFDKQMKLETEKLKQSAESAKVDREHTKALIELLDLQAEQVEQKKELEKAFGGTLGKAYAPKQQPGTSPLETGQAKLQDYLKDVPAGAGLFEKAGAIIKGAPGVFAEQTQRESTMPDYDTPGQLATAMMGLAQTPELRNYIIQQFGIETIASGYNDRIMALQEQLLKGQIDDQEFNRQMQPLILEMKQLEKTGLETDISYKQKATKLLGTTAGSTKKDVGIDTSATFGGADEPSSDINTIASEAADAISMGADREAVFKDMFDRHGEDVVAEVMKIMYGDKG